MQLCPSPSIFRRKFFGDRECGAATGSSFGGLLTPLSTNRGEVVDQKHLARKECVRHKSFCAVMHPKLMIVQNYSYS